jgi:membrane protein DedA with SNARE-associated domain
MYFKMDMKNFLVFTVFGTLIWNAVLVYLGRFAGEAWEKVNTILIFIQHLSEYFWQ